MRPLSIKASAILWIVIVFGYFTANALVEKISFTTPAQTVAAGKASEQLTIQTQDENGNQFKAPATVCILLSSSSVSGEFSSNPANWSAINILTLAKNSANRNFYYKDGTAGSYAIKVRAVSKPESEERSCNSWPASEWPAGWNAEQGITISSGTIGDQENSTTTPKIEDEAPLNHASNESAPSGEVFKPQIFVNAVGPIRGIAGAPVSFEGHTTGLKKEPINNARYIWTFGDGATAEGKKATHTYHYPGVYVVMVSASSGEWSAGDRKDILISSPDLEITEVKAGENGFVTIKNNGSYESDISEWILKTGTSVFVVPKSTMIKANSSVPFPNQISRLTIDEKDTALLFPNGSLAARYSKAVEIAKQSEGTEKQQKISLEVSNDKVEEKNTAVQKKEVMRESEEILTLPFPQNGQLMSAIGSGGGKKGFTPWIFAVTVLIIFALVGYIMVLRPDSPPTKAEIIEKMAEKYEIVE